jgi:outer membrane immunogenic protein
MTRLATFATSLLAASSLAPAFAADLPNRYATPAPYYEPAPVFTWTGFYAGLNGQFAIGSFTQGGGGLFGSPTGGFGGATVGYNYQSGRLVVGAEADVAFGSLSDTAGFGGVSGSGTINGIGTARVRAGYVWDRALIYLTGGYAGTALNGHVSDFGGRPNLMLSESHYLNGYAVGGGVEYPITTKISIKGEYLFTGFNSAGYFAGTRDGINSGANINLIRAGVNYHF